MAALEGKKWAVAKNLGRSRMETHFTPMAHFTHKGRRPIKSFGSSKGISHLSPSGPQIGPYNIKSLGPFGRPTLKYDFQFGPYK